MADAPKILGQVAPPANTVTDLYTVPPNTSTVVSSVTVCNTDSVAHTWRISLAQGGAADATFQYIYYDLPISANDTFAFNLGISLATTDKVRCRTNGAGVVNFMATGIELT